MQSYKRAKPILAAMLAALALTAGAAQTLPSDQQIDEVRKYIKTGWTTLSRSARDLPAAAPDPKLPRKPGQPWPVYVSAKEDRNRLARELAGVLTKPQL